MRYATYASWAILACLASLLTVDAPAQPTDGHLGSYEHLEPGTLHLKSGAQLSGTLAVERPDGQPLRLLYITPDGVEQRFKPVEVRAFRHGDRYVVNYAAVQRDTRIGVRVEERFLERRVDGPRLDLYAPLGAQSRYPYGYFAKEGQAIEKVNYTNLRVALRDDPASAALIRSSRTWRTVQYGMLASGGVATFAGLWRTLHVTREPRYLTGTTTATDRRIDSWLFIGAGTMALSLVPRLIKRAKFRNAVRSYNR